MGTFISRDYRHVNFTLEPGDLPKIYKICALSRIRCEKGRTLANDKSKFYLPAACCANPAAHKPRCASTSLRKTPLHANPYRKQDGRTQTSLCATSPRISRLRN